MKITTFEEDLFGLSGFAERIQKFIAVEQNYVEGGLVIALSSKFGSGKTTFLEMWKSKIENSTDEQGDQPFVISLNAWESDYYGDPLFAIISSLVDCLQENGKPTDSLVEAAKNVGWFATAIGGQIVKKVSGIDPLAAGNLAEKKEKDRRDNFLHLPMDTFSIYQERKNAMKELKIAIQKFVAGSEPKVLFLVDELDRCRPDFAISYLETIKHIFDIKGAVFILAADRHQLANSAKTAFGTDLDFEEYYRKFIHREITLPPISSSGYSKLVSAYISHYLELENKRNCFMKIDGDREKNICELIESLKLTPRQVQEIFRILGHVFETSEDNKGRLRWCLADGTIAMAALRIGDPKVYRLIGSQQFEPQDAYKFLSDLIKEQRYVERWFFLFLTGGGIKKSDKESDEDIIIKTGIMEGGEKSEIKSRMEPWRGSWGNFSSSRFVEIYDKIEQLLQWN